MADHKAQGRPSREPELGGITEVTRKEAVEDLESKETVNARRTGTLLALGIAKSSPERQ
eukprot:CAMPEP_0170628610 /NCGR_PEP_ID=MMETSP0224-20130122/32794_1 /TAXON_ID=285029 /ORGANISM="Togula jolla, Strain CCCM 725" /LENGTH=58 /DNA_ID=CAMNT_0010956083 /DNA_START=1 /DNA_END=175 /DNA_ORIENTATION=+